MVPVDKARLHELVQSVYDAESPEVFEAYSEYDRELVPVPDFESLEELMVSKLREGKSFFDFAIWYPSCGGRVEKERIQLKPETCNGHDFRYAVGGWGIFHMQLDFKRDPMVESRIAVNSQKRAVKWESVYHEWLAVESWNWSVVRKHERRLMRKLRSLA